MTWSNVAALFPARYPGRAARTLGHVRGLAAAAPARAQAPVTAVPVEGTGTTTAVGADTVIDDMQTFLGTVAITSA